VPGHRRGRTQAAEQVGLAGPAVADQAERVALGDPGAGRELSDQRGLDVRVGLVVEARQPLLPGEFGCGQPPGRAPAVPVVALGHEQLGEEPAVGQLLALRGLGQLDEPGAHRGQPQHPAGLVDRGDRGRVGQPGPTFRECGPAPAVVSGVAVPVIALVMGLLGCRWRDG